jgi:hypothetical protein
MSNLPPDPYDRTVIVETNLDNPDRSSTVGTGRDIVVTMNPPSVVGREKMFLASDGKWVPFTTTEFTSWGAIIGDIEDQADLMAMFALYPKTDTLAPVAFTGDYGQLINKPPLGTVSPINLDGLTSHFLRGDGTWQIPVDVTAVWGNIGGDINAQTDLMTLLNLKAPILSPAFTGTPTAPTPPVDDNTTRISTTAWFFGQAFNASPLMNAPTASSGLLTKWARGDHVHPTDTSRAPLDSPAFINLPTAPTPPVGNSTQRLATTAFVANAIAAAGVIPPPLDGKMYGMLNGAWTEIKVGTKWDNAG